MKNGFYSFLRGFLYLPVKFIFPVKVIGKENLPLPEKVITVSNHLVWIDVAIVAVNVKGYRHLIAKKELTENRLFAKFMKGAGAIPIDRGKADLTAMRAILGALKKGEGIAIFPEGTRNKKSEEMQGVKAGAALFALKSGAPVVPVMILHRQRVFRRNYIYVAKPVTFEEFEGMRADSSVVECASAKIENAMRTARDYLTDYVENKREKEIRREKKAARRREKSYRKEARLAEKRMKKFMEGKSE